MVELHNISDGEFHVSNDLTTETARSLWEESKKKFPPTHANTIIIDVSKVINVDSGGLALLVAWVRWATSHNKKFQIQGIPKKLDALIHNNSLEKLFYSA